MEKSTLYTNGCCLVKKEFPLYDLVLNIAKRIKDEAWPPANPDFDDYAQKWQGFRFIDGYKKLENHDRFPEISKVEDFFETNISLMGLYNAKPNSKLHPHIDMAGNLPFGKLRFHIPIMTHDQAFFFAGKQHNRLKINMKEKEFWALDTSHTHFIKNTGNRDRIHLIVQVDVNDWVLNLLPKKNFWYFRHVFLFWVYDVPQALSKRFLRKFHILKPKTGY
jgi:hypothetical protein